MSGNATVMQRQRVEKQYTQIVSQALNFIKQFQASLPLSGGSKIITIVNLEHEAFERAFFYLRQYKKFRLIRDQDNVIISC